MDLAWPEDLDRLRDEVLDFVVTATADLELIDDAWLRRPSKEFNKRLGNAGYIGLRWSPEYGGGGRSPIEHFVVMETLLLAGAPVSGAWFPDRQIGPVLLQYGTEDQKQRWLPGIVAGDSSWAIGMSEPDAGSNVAGISTRADLDGDVFIVNGQKIWTSGAADADFCYLICRTSSDGPPHKGLSELVVDMSLPGIEVAAIHDSAWGDHFNEVFFDDVRVPADCLIGEMNNTFAQTMRQLEHERGGVDRLVSNKRLYLDVLPLADTSDPLVRQRVAAIETKYSIGRHLVLRNVLGQAPPGHSAIAKTFCTEFEQEVADFASHILGPRATLATDGELEGRVARNVVYAPSYTIMGGTTQILRNIIGERVLGLPREPR
ncbi:MAG: acyl-CoA dehydrogenase [Actinomycetia bacterium]|nr:acyl-CoA dehydrogenase [Actinomycetes bacterium]